MSTSQESRGNRFETLINENRGSTQNQILGIYPDRNKGTIGRGVLSLHLPLKPYHSHERIAPTVLGATTRIYRHYFLVDGDNFSASHRIQSDELWHFYVGNPLVVHIIGEDGDYSEIQLGNEPESGQVLQGVVKAGCWCVSRVKDRQSFALVGCTVAPGFAFEDFELAKRSQLIALYSEHRDLIEQLTRA